MYTVISCGNGSLYTKEIMRELGVETKLMGESGLYGRRCIKDLYGVGKSEARR